MSSSTALFACSRCYSRHPFEELSAGQQLCKECRGAYPVVKCTYCRSEFQQTSKASTTSICKKCELNVKSYGKPSPCEYCNIIAAFIGNKCQRCTNAEKKYGPPVQCEQCKQKCAFDRKDEDKKVDGKLLCWLCTLSYKRAVAKTKSTDPTRHSHVKLGGGGGGGGQPTKNKEPKKPHDKRPQRVDVTKLNQLNDDSSPPPSKKSMHGHHGHHNNNNSNSNSNNNSTTGQQQQQQLEQRREQLDSHNCSDHVVALTQLREQIANLNRQLGQKDQQLLAKDRQITELKANNFTTENELRLKLKEAQRDYETKVQQMTGKLKTMQKELAKKDKEGKILNKSSLTIVRQATTVKQEIDMNNKESPKSCYDDESN